MRIQAIIEAAICVDDLQAAETFYGTILGLRVMGRRGRMMPMLRVKSSFVGLPENGSQTT